MGLGFRLRGLDFACARLTLNLVSHILSGALGGQLNAKSKVPRFVQKQVSQHIYALEWMKVHCRQRFLNHVTPFGGFRK